MDLKDKINKNKFYKILLSLVMAIFLWSWVIGVENPEIEIPYRGIDVAYEGETYLNKEGLSIISPKNPKVNISIRGNKSDLNNIDSHNLKASLDLQGLKAGENKVPVEYSLQGQTGNIRIVNVEPSTILVKLDEIISENKKIDIEILGDLPDSYTVGEVRALNSFVRVTGPSSDLAQIARVVSYADVSSKTESFMVKSKLVFLDKNDLELNNIKASATSVEVEVPIYKIKSVPIRLKTYGSLKPNERLENIKPLPENIVIRGSSANVDKIKEIESESINISKLVEDNNFKVKLKLPEGISLHENIDIKVSYDHIIEIEESRKIPLEKIDLIGQNPTYTYEILYDLEELTVNLLGREDLLTKLVDDDISLFLNVSGLEAGDHLIDIQGNLSEDIKIKNTEPTALMIRITNGEEPVEPEELINKPGSENN
ncbi:MAG: CdaR family protein [Bacillota bacterium]|nr:CdaR family protein [Bacillota bacterium]